MLLESMKCLLQYWNKGGKCYFKWSLCHQKSLRISHLRKLHTEIPFKFYDLRKFMYVKFSIFTVPQHKTFCEWVVPSLVRILNMQYTSVKTFFVIDQCLLHWNYVVLFSVGELLLGSYINQTLFRTSVFCILRGTPNYWKKPSPSSHPLLI